MIQAKSLASRKSAGIADAGDVIDLLDECAPRVVRHHDVFPPEQGHVLGLKDRPDQAQLGTTIVADADAVQATGPVDLSA